MPVDLVAETLLDVISKEAQMKDEEQRKSGYWMLCPYCGKKVMKKQLIKNGCYLCKWKGTEEEIKTAQAKQMHQLSKSKRVKPLAIVNKENKHSYRTKCPECGIQVIMKELEEKGCYICGWKPKWKIRRKKK